MDNYILFDADISEEYTDKEYIDTNDFIKNNLNNFLITDTISIVLQYLNNTVPLCMLCKGKAKKNVIVKYRETQEFDNEYGNTCSMTINEICICITCLSRCTYNKNNDVIEQKMLCICNNIIEKNDLIQHYNLYNHTHLINYYKIFKKLFNTKDQKFFKIICYIAQTINHGIIEIFITNYDLWGLWWINTSILQSHIKLYNNENYPIYKLN